MDKADDTWHVQRMAGRSPDDEFGSTLDNDLMLLNVALLAIGLFTYVAISDWQNGFVGSRFLLTIGGTAPAMYMMIALAAVTFHDQFGVFNRSLSSEPSPSDMILPSSITTGFPLHASYHYAINTFHAGLLNIVFAYVACEGFAGYIGIFYSDLVLILPFIMLGVGVDGMFVLQGAMDATDPNDTMEVHPPPAHCCTSCSGPLDSQLLCY